MQMVKLDLKFFYICYLYLILSSESIRDVRGDFEIISPAILRFRLENSRFIEINKLTNYTTEITHQKFLQVLSLPL